ncbi:lipoprotein-releasing ABC transporter permease subunit [Entomobacter blattae]|uniref:Lipoprotein-releasing system transmembrane protein LolE n=1 Tax=Entomobacter blattae TaxID=2762277 RepID=A0A7H1NSY6_9PROT|nr:lipoprotein-releasing ABC transporter permease subunit [Entomobacter blattae]QNT78896.1 Lipoprotein-releasing system transmembrane protein LolE [Entomobacter blattae]
MFGPFERKIAGRYLRARKGERFVSIIAIFSLIGIALGVATLIIVMSVMNGFKADLLGRILGLNGDLSIYGKNTYLGQYQTLAERLKTVPGVKSVTPLVDGQVLLSVGQYSGGGLLRGIRPEDFKNMPAISSSIVMGNLTNFNEPDAIVIGITLARRANLTVGSDLTVISPNGAATAFGTVPRIKTYHVVAIFDAGVRDYNASYAFIPLHSAQIYFQMPDAVTLIQVATTDPEHVRSVTKTIEQALQHSRVRVQDWTQSNNAFFGAVQVEQNVMFLILTLIIIVAAFNVISSLIMMVKDKNRDIAVLRTMGASKGAIMRIFLMCGASVGVFGTVAGTVLGIIFCLNIEHIRQGLQAITGTNLFNPEVYYLEHLPAKLVWGQVIEVVVMALALSLLATLYPSWKAAKTDPVEALRHE